MKRLLFLSAMALLTAVPLTGQKLVIGDRAPELKLEWFGEAPDPDGKITMVEFFHSSNKASVNRLGMLDELARTAGDELNVIVVTREHTTGVKNTLTSGDPHYYAGLDKNGTTFTAFKAHYLPYSVIYDKKGRIIWLGNPSSLSADDVKKMLK